MIKIGFIKKYLNIPFRVETVLSFHNNFTAFPSFIFFLFKSIEKKFKCRHVFHNNFFWKTQSYVLVRKSEVAFD